MIHQPTAILWAAGLGNKEIAQHVFLTEKAVKHYITNIIRKLQVPHRAEAALLAQRVDSQGSRYILNNCRR